MRSCILLVLALALFTPVAHAAAPATEASPADASRAEAPVPAVDLDALFLVEEPGEGCAAGQLALTPEPIYQSTCLEDCRQQSRQCRSSCGCTSKPCPCYEDCFAELQACTATC